MRVLTYPEYQRTTWLQRQRIDQALRGRERQLKLMAPAVAPSAPSPREVLEAELYARSAQRGNQK